MPLRILPTPLTVDGNWPRWKDARFGQPARAWFRLLIVANYATPLLRVGATVSGAKEADVRENGIAPRLQSLPGIPRLERQLKQQCRRLGGACAASNLRHVEPAFTTNEAKRKLAEIARYQDLVLAIDTRCCWATSTAPGSKTDQSACLIRPRSLVSCSRRNGRHRWLQPRSAQSRVPVLTSYRRCAA
jgi:hypothetical protein